MIEFSEEAKRRYQTILSHYPEKRAALLPVLTLAQREFGWISQEVAEYVGGLMGYPPSDVLSVATFYTMLHKKPAGKYHIDICKNVSCWLMGVNPALMRSAATSVEEGDHRDGRFSWGNRVSGSCGTARRCRSEIDTMRPRPRDREIIDGLRRARIRMRQAGCLHSQHDWVLPAIDKPGSNIAKYRERGGSGSRGARWSRPRLLTK
jgi:NADH:ubiquinone oxidoreductase subunit E